MKKLKKLLVLTLFFVLISLVNYKVLADNSSYSEQNVPYSEAYQKWLQLSDEEKKNTLMPRMYDIEYTETTPKNPFLKSNMLQAALNPRYTLKDVIANNLAIRNQRGTNSCWAFAALSSLETNLALTNYKDGTNTSKVYDFSERHMEYATSRVFENNQINPIGYNRAAGIGGNWYLASSYLTNGSGAINETEMPFENNEDTIAINLIQGKTVATQVYDTVEFANYNKASMSTSDSNAIKNQIKNHIQNYGSVYGLALSGGNGIMSNISSNGTLGVGRGTVADHAISIIGWDDNYSKSNWDEFGEENRPNSNGAWIARNSWGETAGDNGLLYISYEDEIVSLLLAGIVKATDTVEYENIYQYDYYYPNGKASCRKKTMLCNVFDKKTSGKEYLTQVSLHVPGTYTCRVFVNPNGSGKSKDGLHLVPLKAGQSETINAGYHTLEFENPIEITSNQFAVAIEISSTDNSSVSVSYVKKDENLYSPVEIQTGKCFKLDTYEYLSQDDWSGWTDLGTDNHYSGISTIKAFTISELIDESLKNIEIITPPTKTNYLVGEDFDDSGMVVKANYNSTTNPSVILDSSSYSITNGTNLKVGQTSVIITYEGKTAQQPIQVTENKVESISITTPPTKTEYWAGEDFDNSGMVVKATYTNGTITEVTDYTVANGLGLRNNQSSVTVSYNGKNVDQTITVKENAIVRIEITKSPNKVDYVVGQNFNSTGMIVKAIYTNGMIREITDYEVNGGNNLSEGQTIVTIYYEGQSATQVITVVEKAITQISVKTLPTKLEYIQNKEELDLTGGIIEIRYNDATTESIEMTADEVSIAGFNNSELGKRNITVTYLSKTTQYEIEIIEDTTIEENPTEETPTEETPTEENAQNSKMENAEVNIQKVKSYYFTNNSKKDYTLVEVEISGIEKNTNNDKMQYYYFLSTNQSEDNITDWVEIEENQLENNSLRFTIDTSSISNYNEISNAEVVYLYIKEVASKGGNQSVSISNPMKLESDIEIETYVDDVKTVVDTSNNASKNTSNGKVEDFKLPYTGSKAVIIIATIILITATGIISYKKYKLFRDIK